MVGNRPQFIKAAAVSGPLREVADEILVNTGQHHDPELSDVFFTELGLRERLDGIESRLVTQPPGHVDFDALLANCRVLLTDSDCARKEAYLHGDQCITPRHPTEWVETVDTGWNSLTGMDPVATAAAFSSSPSGELPELYGDTRAAARVATALTIAQS